MAKRYRRRESGLLLADDALSLPKVEMPQPWWAGKITGARGMSRRRCCCATYCALCPAANVREWTLDLGLGGWSGCCPICEEIHGLYVLSSVSTNCSWAYDAEFGNCPGGVFPICNEDDASGFLHLSLGINYVLETGYQWNAGLYVYYPGTINPPQVAYQTAIWKTAFFATYQECMSVAEEDGSILLTTAGESSFGGCCLVIPPNGWRVCGGSLPNTVTAYR